MTAASFRKLALTPPHVIDQGSFVKMHPRAFIPVKGKWGEQGATNIVLRYATAAA